MKKMNEEIKARLYALWQEAHTDSDIEDFCAETGISASEAFHQIAEWRVPEVCKGCKHIAFFNSMYPCNACSRIMKDRYEAE